MAKVAKKDGKKSSTPNLWAYRVGALVMALLLWVYVGVSENQSRELTFSVPIELRNPPEGLAVMNQNYQVQVRVQGSPTIVDRLSTSNIVAYVDLSGAEAGLAVVEVRFEPLPDGVTLSYQSLTEIEVRLEQIRTEAFTLTVEQTGELPANYTALDPVLSPSQVSLSGPSDYINQVAKVYVVANLDGATEYDENLTIEVSNSDGQNITDNFTISPATANVVVPIIYSQPERTVSVRVDRIGTPALGYKVSSVSVTPSTVKVFGDLDQLEQLDYIMTEQVDVSDLKANTNIKVNLAVPSGFTVSTQQVTVAVQIEPLNDATFTKTLILAENVEEGLTVDIVQQPLEVRVSGPETFIAELQEGQITPYVDCVGLAAGVYSLPVNVSLPANITLVRVSPSLVTVTLTETQPADGEGANPDEEVLDVGATPADPSDDTSAENDTAEDGVEQ